MSTSAFVEDRVSKALLEVATPDLYRSNGFRILGLPVTATAADVIKQKDKIKKSLKFGEAGLGNALLPIIPKPGIEDIDQAAHYLLGDPVNWLIDELFWLWSPEGADQDQGFQMVRQNNLRGALNYWSTVPHNKPEGAIAVHNTAVLNHLMALDIEVVLNADERRSWQQKLDTYWSEAYLNWWRVIEDDLLWDWLSRRILELSQQLGDRRLTTGAARRLRLALPTAIITVGAKLAVHAAKNGDLEEVERHLSYLLDSNFDPDLIDKILEREAEPLIEQIKRLCQPVPEESKATPCHANELARKLFTDTERILDAIAALLGEDHQVTDFAHNQVARVIRNCLIDFGNETEDWKECCNLLEQAGTLARNAVLREQIDTDIAQVKENLSWKQRKEQAHRLSEEMKTAVASGLVYDVTLRGGSARVPNACTCCLGAPSSHQKVSYSWEETRNFQRYKRTFSFDFPLCSDCLGHQNEYNLKRIGLVALVAVVSISVGAAVLGLLAQIDNGPLRVGGNGLPLAQQDNSLTDISAALLIGASVTTALLFLLGRFFRLRELSDEHASREQPIKLLTAGDMHMTFRFYHPLYAYRFAESNNTGTREGKATKAPRGTGIITKATLVSTLLPSLVVAGIGQAIVFSAIQDAARQRIVHSSASNPVTPSKQSDTLKSSVAAPANKNLQKVDASSGRREKALQDTTPPASAPVYPSTGLKEKIESGKARARSLDIQLDQMQSQIKSLAAQIDQYKVEIDQYERRMKLGIEVNEYVYKEALRAHNALVIEHNDSLSKYRSIRAEYDSLIDSVNEMVHRYNAGER